MQMARSWKPGSVSARGPERSRQDISISISKPAMSVAPTHQHPASCARKGSSCGTVCIEGTIYLVSCRPKPSSWRPSVVTVVMTVTCPDCVSAEGRGSAEPRVYTTPTPTPRPTPRTGGLQLQLQAQLCSCTRSLAAHALGDIPTPCGDDASGESHEIDLTAVALQTPTPTRVGGTQVDVTLSWPRDDALHIHIRIRICIHIHIHVHIHDHSHIHIRAILVVRRPGSATPGSGTQTAIAVACRPQPASQRASQPASQQADPECGWSCPWK